MKKIIAAALSVLVGACGYTIVDKELTKRVDDLEHSVSSMQEQLNQTVTTNKPVTSHTQETQQISVGYELPLSSSQKQKFLIKWDGYDSYYVRTGEGPYVTPSRDDIYLKEYFIYIDNSTAKVTDIYNDTKTYYNSEYTIYTKVYQTYTVNFCIKGHTSVELAGGNISFYLHASAYNDTTPTVKINDNGYFEINFSLNISPTSDPVDYSFDSPDIFKHSPFDYTVLTSSSPITTTTKQMTTTTKMSQ